MSDDHVKSLTARIREQQKDAPKTTAEAAEALATAVQSGAGVTVCYTRCWGCMFGQCYDPPRQHPWWDVEDVAHAKATGQPEPTGTCACQCAKEAP